MASGNPLAIFFGLSPDKLDFSQVELRCYFVVAGFSPTVWTHLKKKDRTEKKHLGEVGYWVCQACLYYFGEMDFLIQNRVQQLAGISFLGRFKQFIGGANFYHFPMLHNQHSVRNKPNHCQIVGNKEQRKRIRFL